MTFLTAILSDIRSFVSSMNLIADSLPYLLLAFVLFCVALLCFCFSGLLFWDLVKLLLG